MTDSPFRIPPPLPEGFEERIWERVRAVLEAERRRQAASDPVATVRRFPRRPAWQRLAAAAALVAAAALGWWGLGPGAAKPGGGPDVWADAPGTGAAGATGSGTEPPAAPPAPAGETGRSERRPAVAGDVDLILTLESAAGTPLEYASLVLQPVDAGGRPLGEALGGGTLRQATRALAPGRLRLRLASDRLPRGTAALDVHPRGAGFPAAGRIPLEDEGQGQAEPPPLASTATYSYGATVVDADSGLPLAGAVVRYVPASSAFDPTRITTGLPPDSCPLEFTGTDGVFAGLTDHEGVHSLVVALPGYVPLQVDGVRPDLATGLPAQVALQRGRTIAGTVTTAGGEPVPDLLLRLGGGFPRAAGRVDGAIGWRRFQTVRTAADGSFQATGFAEPGSDAFLLLADVAGIARGADPLPGVATWLDAGSLPDLADPALDEVGLAAPGLAETAVVGPGWLGVPLAEVMGDLDLRLDLHRLEVRVQDFELRPSPDAVVRVRASDSRFASLEAPVDATRGSAVFLVPPDRTLRLTASNAAGEESGLTLVPPVTTAAEAVTLTLFPQDRAGVDFILRDSLGQPVAGARSAPFLEDLPFEAAEAVPVRPGSPDGHYRLLLPPGHHTLGVFGPPAPRTIGPFGHTLIEVDLADGQYVDLGELTLPRGLAVEVRLLAGIGDSSRKPGEALPSNYLRAVPVARLAVGSGPLQATRVLVTPSPDWYPEAVGVEAERPHSADWTWDPALQDWVRHFYLRRRLPAGSWSLELSLPGLLPASVQPVSSTGGDEVLQVDLQLPPAGG